MRVSLLLNSKIKQINTSSIGTVAQQSYCTDEALSAQARRDIALSGNVTQEAFNARKRALNQALCVGDARSDPQTKANILAMNKQNPTWDTFLAVTGCNMSKSTAQQIADLQNKLQALRTKKARQDRREETRQKIILGAEVAKVLNSKPEEVNKALIIGLLSKIKDLDDDERQEFTRLGLNILEEWKNENSKP